MTKIQTYCYSALCLLAVFCLSTTVSLAQRTTESSSTTIDPFAVLPPSDALIVVDLKRFSSEVTPRLLADEPEARALVFALPGRKGLELLEPLALQRMVIGVRYKRQDEKNPSNLEGVIVAHSSEAVQLPALLRSRGSGKYREQQYAGKILYFTQEEQSEAKSEATTGTSSDESEWAIVALDANTLVFGTPAGVRSSIDIHAGKGTAVSAELVADVKRNSKGLLSVAGLVPPSLISAVKEWLNSDLDHTLSSLKRFYASVELTSTGFVVAVTLNTASPEQSKSLVDLLTALKTLVVNFVPGKTKGDKLLHDLVKGVMISAEGTEVQIRDEITQASVNEVAKQSFADIYSSRGLAHVENEDSDAAIVEYNKSILLVSDNALTFIDRGKAQVMKGNLDAAFADYDKAISLDPDNAPAYNHRCFAQMQKKDFDAATVDCGKAIALDPNFASAYNNRASAFASQGKFDKAMPDYDQAIVLNSKNSFALKNRGYARIRIGNWDGAIADFEKAITIYASVDSYNGRGLARYYKGDIDLALADFEKALALNPNAALAYNNRALALVEKGNFDRAMADYDKSIALNDKNDLVYTNRADLRYEKGDFNEAIADFDKAIALNPKSVNAYNGRGLARYSKEEWDLAIADFDKAIAIEPNASAYYLNRAYARTEKSDYDKAIADVDKVISLDPKSAEAYNARGLARFYKDDLDQSIVDYNKAIAIDPNFAEAYGNRALSLVALGRDAQAEKDLNKCFALDESLRDAFNQAVKEIKKTRRTKSRKHH